ncbi:NAD(P)-dependent oxidoreductase [Acidobacteria bacterium AB60]|nr:NAD(P)-dependent oxidoreductase [Acidobacteria bacterium AB60]
MKVAFYGANGNIGRRILDELLKRGHLVTAVVRDTSKLAARDGLRVIAGDVNDVQGITAASKGADALLSAYGPGHEHPEKLVPVMRNLLTGAEQSGVPRFVFVGGAGSLEVAPGVTLIDSGHLPEEWKGIAIAHRDALELARASAVNWTCLSPAAFIEPGKKTGKFRIGGDRLLTDDRGESRISMEDFAAALVDELENPQQERRRFTVAY